MSRFWLLALLGASTALANPDVPAPGSVRWEPVEFESIERHTRYEAIEVAGAPGEASWHATADCAASGRIVELPTLDLARTPLLSWRWRVERPLEAGDERSRAGDDFAARVYLVFAFEPAAASWLERLERRVAAALSDRELPGAALNYVWARRAPIGSHWPNPHRAENHMIVARSGSEAGSGWQNQTVDLAADAERYLGARGRRAVALAIMTDSDQSCGHAVAWYADFRFHARSRGRD